MHKPKNSQTYKNIGLVLMISLIYIVGAGIIIIIIVVSSDDKISSPVFGFHTNSTRGIGIPGIGIPNMEGLQPAIKAQKHINAASQALQNGNNSEVSLQLQLANDMLSYFIGSGFANITSGNITAFLSPPAPPPFPPGLGETGSSTNLTNNQTGSVSNSLERELSTQISRQQEICGDRIDNDGDGRIDHNCPQ
jgi:hypothetical protein